MRTIFSLISFVLLMIFGSVAMAAPGPDLPVGVWTRITPKVVTMTNDNHVFCQGVTLDPSNSSTIYLCVCAYDVSKGGLYKTTDGGAHWAKIGPLALKLK